MAGYTDMSSHAPNIIVLSLAPDQRPEKFWLWIPGYSQPITELAINFPEEAIYPCCQCGAVRIAAIDRGVRRCQMAKLCQCFTHDHDFSLPLKGEVSDDEDDQDMEDNDASSVSMSSPMYYQPNLIVTSNLTTPPEPMSLIDSGLMVSASITAQSPESVPVTSTTDTNEQPNLTNSSDSKDRMGAMLQKHRHWYSINRPCFYNCKSPDPNKPWQCAQSCPAEKRRRPRRRRRQQQQ
ncbi:hypothetical protein SCUP234_10668 [Seiridium cupressi]